MSKEQKIELLWSELMSIENIYDRRAFIYQETKKKKPKYKILADEEPYRLFEFLGGDESKVDNLKKWVWEYTNDDYTEENDMEYDSVEANNWDVEEKSIEHAIENWSNYSLTGTVVILGPNNIELEFEFDFTEGCIEGII